MRSATPPSRRGKQAPSAVPLLLLGLSALAGTAPLPAATPTFFADPGSRAPFSPAVRVGDVLYLSGQIGAEQDGTIPADFDRQATLAMDGIGAALKRAGAGYEDVFRCTVMLADMRNWAAFNRVYLRYFKPGRLPARSAFGANGLALGAGLEVECQAAAR